MSGGHHAVKLTCPALKAARFTKYIIAKDKGARASFAGRLERSGAALPLYPGLQAFEAQRLLGGGDALGVRKSRIAGGRISSAGGAGKAGHVRLAGSGATGMRSIRVPVQAQSSQKAAQIVELGLMVIFNLLGDPRGRVFSAAGAHRERFPRQRRAGANLLGEQEMRGAFAFERKASAMKLAIAQREERESHERQRQRGAGRPARDHRGHAPASRQISRSRARRIISPRTFLPFTLAHISKASQPPRQSPARIRADAVERHQARAPIL